MIAVVLNHPMLAIFAAFLAGFLGEWLLELLFFRRRLFDTEAALQRREREVADLRFELARAGERLKNREIELEATQKSRQGAETQIALSRHEIDRLKTELRLVEAELEQKSRIEEGLNLRLEAESAALAKASRLAQFFEDEFEREKSTVAAGRGELAIVTAQLATEQAAQAAAQSNLEAQGADLAATLARVEALEKSLGAADSARESLVSSLRNRDAELVEARAKGGELEKVCEVVSQALASADERCADLSAQTKDLKIELEKSVTELQASRARLTAEVAKTEVSARARTQSETLLKRREAELTDIERKVAEYQSAFEGAAKENTRLTQEIGRLGPQILAADAARKQSETMVKRREAELADAERKAVEYQTAFDDAAKENSRLAQEVGRLGPLVQAADAARKETESLLRQREAEMADVRREVAEHVSANEHAGKEAIRLAQEVSRLETQVLAAITAREQAETEKARLEAELASKEARLAELPKLVEAARDTSGREELAQAQLQIKEHTAQIEAAQANRAAVEAELQAVSASHALLELELGAVRREFSQARAAARNAATPPRPTVNVETVMRDLDAVTRERNELAAELAGLKSQLAEAAAKEAAALVSASPATDVKVAVPEALAVPEAESLELPFPVDPAANGQILEYSAECPQRLGEVRGIGAAFETQLFSAGIGSYWQLSQLTDERLSEVLELNHEARAAFDFSAVKAEALKRAEETESLGRKWSGEAPDDLTMIDDLTEAFQRKLADAGICTFATLAQSSPELLARICPSVSARPVDYSVWIDQARLLAEASAA